MDDDITYHIRANSPGFEYVYVANQRCQCGGTFETVRQELYGQTSGNPVDRLVVRCKGCGQERSFDFDIRSFFGQFEKYSHFHQTDDHFREAMGHVRAGRWAEAEASLRMVVDEEQGEPAFAWGHYHLGMVLLKQDRPTEALVQLERAAAIQPLEPAIHEGLGWAHQAAGHHEEAQAHLEECAALRSRFGPEDE